MDAMAREVLGSFERLRAAGILESVTYDQREGGGMVRYAAPFLRLLLAGRRPLEDPTFLALFAGGDPAQVRAWIEREAARLLPEAQL